MRLPVYDVMIEDLRKALEPHVSKPLTEIGRVCVSLTSQFFALLHRSMDAVYRMLEMNDEQRGLMIERMDAKYADTHERMGAVVQLMFKNVFNEKLYTSYLAAMFYIPMICHYLNELT